MTRRELIALLVSTAAGVWPGRARAQQSERMRRVAVLVGYAENDPETKGRLTAFRQRLEKRGWSDGRNVLIETRFMVGTAVENEALARQVVATRPDVILAHTTAVAAALQRESHTVPIVFVNVSDPIGSTFVTSLARPGGNLTGILHYEAGITGKWLGMLKEIAPQLVRVAFVANPKTTAYDYFLRAAESVTTSLAIELVPTRLCK